jgi:hypothetical protein
VAPASLQSPFLRSLSRLCTPWIFLSRYPASKHRSTKTLNSSHRWLLTSSSTTSILQTLV